MRIVECPNRKHRYDADKYAVCPYCSPSAANEGRPEGNNDGETVAFFAPGGDPGKTVSQARPVQLGKGSYRGVNSFSNQNTMGSGAVTGANSRPGIPAGQPRSNSSVEKEEPPTESFFANGNAGTMSGWNPLQEWKTPDFDSDVTVPQMAVSDPGISQYGPVVGWLVCIEGSSRGSSYVLHAGKNFIGRKSTYDIFLPDDKYVSRDVHASIIYEPKQNIFYAQPGDSHSLFYLNDKVVLTNIQLHDRDILEVGRTKLMFVPFCNEKFSWKAE